MRIEYRNHGFLAALLAVMSLGAPLISNASPLQIKVLDVDGNPVPDVVVYIEQSESSEREAPKPAVMDQRNSRFEPHILVIEKGAAVEFPNRDSIAHHVYSFSKPNNFVLPLYKGTPPDPKVFEFEGVVTLGCNIHDSMLGYVVVLDTTIFGKTDASGSVRLDVSNAVSPLAVSAWSPRFQDFDRPEVSIISLDGKLTTTISLQQALRPAHEDTVEDALWDDYD